MDNKLFISASILASNNFNYKDLIFRLVKANIQAIHIDVMDGSITPGFGLNPAIILLIPNHIYVDIHIMSKDPIRVLNTIPYRPNTYVHTHFSTVDNFELFVKAVKEKKLIPGITFDLNDNLQNLTFIYDCKFINFMSITNIGLTNQEFDIKVINKIIEFKTLYPKLDILICVDGSVRMEHIKLLSKIVNIIVVGSILFSNKNYKKAIKKIINFETNNTN